MTRNQIKGIAIAAMLMNHIAHVFMQPGTAPAVIFTGIGYFTAPVMCYMLVQGFVYTRSRFRYGARLLVFALLSQVPFRMVFGPGTLNMLFTLFFCFLILCVKENVNDRLLRMALVITLITVSQTCDWPVVAPLLTMELYDSHTASGAAMSYGVCAGLVVLFTYLSVAGDPAYSIFSAGALSLLAGFAVAMAYVTILYAHDGQKEKRRGGFSKWFFYLFYPGHLLILYAINIL